MVDPICGNEAWNLGSNSEVEVGREFEEQRGYLFSIGYRLIGSVTDAERHGPGNLSALAERKG